MTDLLLVGASGFAGRRVARHLHRRCHELGLHLTLAGRSLERLARVRDEIKQPDLPDPELLQMDLHDAESCRQAAETARVILSTVGPYQLHGRELVAACAAAGTDYADLTGEVPWMREMIDAHHEAARDAGCRIVHACGFDSVPSDLGVMTAQNQARDAAGRTRPALELLLGPSEGGFSRGTFDSLIGVLRAALRSERVRAVMRDVHSLEPRWPEGHAGSRPLPRGWRTADGRWALPFVMEGINARVVHRSHALAGYPWGTDFSYRELIPLGSGPGGLLAATAGRMAMKLFLAALAFGPTRWLVSRFLPAPGSGPAIAERDGGSFRVTICDGNDGSALVDVSARRDPGYGATAIMLAEAGLLLRQTADEPGRAVGVLTPSAALGTTYVAALNAAGVMVEVR